MLCGSPGAGAPSQGAHSSQAGLLSTMGRELLLAVGPVPRLERELSPSFPTLPIQGGWLSSRSRIWLVFWHSFSHGSGDLPIASRSYCR